MRVVVAGRRGPIGGHLVAALHARSDDVLLRDGPSSRGRALAAALAGADGVVALAERAQPGIHMAAVVDALANVPPPMRPLVLVNLSGRANGHDEAAEREALQARALGVRVVLLRAGRLPHRSAAVACDDVIGFTLHALRAWDVVGLFELGATGTAAQATLGAAERSGYRFACGSVRDAACSNVSDRWSPSLPITHA